MKMKSDVIWCNDGWFPIIFLRDHCLQNCHSGRQIVDLVDINFVLRRCENAICDHKTNDFPLIMIIFNTTAPIQNHFYSHFPLTLYDFATKASDASNVKPDVSQWKATLRNSVGFLTIYRVIFTKDNSCNYIDSVGEENIQAIYISRRNLYTKCQDHRMHRYKLLEA